MRSTIAHAPVASRLHADIVPHAVAVLVFNVFSCGLYVLVLHTGFTPDTFRCRIGAGAVVAEGSIVEDGGQIAAGTVVPPACLVPKNELWAGNPAK